MNDSTPPNFPAFPRPHSECNEARRGSGCVESQIGMTLRDYFAAKALTGAIAAHVAAIDKHDELPAQAIADDCWRIADAMLKAREAK